MDQQYLTIFIILGTVAAIYCWTNPHSFFDQLDIQPRSEFGDANNFAMSTGTVQSNPYLVGAPQRPTVHPSVTTTVHSLTDNVNNSTMDAVHSIRGTGVFSGSELKPRARVAVKQLRASDVLAATSRPRSVPVPGVFKKNANRQIRPEPVVSSGVGTLPSISSLKSIRRRETELFGGLGIGGDANSL